MAKPADSAEQMDNEPAYNEFDDCDSHMQPLSWDAEQTLGTSPSSAGGAGGPSFNEGEYSYGEH